MTKIIFKKNTKIKKKKNKTTCKTQKKKTTKQKKNEKTKKKTCKKSYSKSFPRILKYLLINIYKEAVSDLTEDIGYLCSTLLQPFAETFSLPLCCWASSTV
jgi:hypothetical protein